MLTRPAVCLVVMLVAVSSLPRLLEAAGDAAAKPAKPPTMLKYGDGRADGKKSYGGTGMMIRFEMPEGMSMIKGLKIHGSRYGTRQAPKEDFEINLLTESMDELLHTEEAPYRLFKRGSEKWVRVGFKDPVEVPSAFWVALDFKAHQTKGVYLSFDTETQGEHSRVGLAGDDADKVKPSDTGGDWMVQVMLAKP